MNIETKNKRTDIKKKKNECTNHWLGKQINEKINDKQTDRQQANRLHNQVHHSPTDLIAVRQKNKLSNDETEDRANKQTIK